MLVLCSPWCCGITCKHVSCTLDWSTEDLWNVLKTFLSFSDLLGKSQEFDPHYMIYNRALPLDRLSILVFLKYAVVYIRFFPDALSHVSRCPWSVRKGFCPLVCPCEQCSPYNIQQCRSRVSVQWQQAFAVHSLPLKSQKSEPLCFQSSLITLCCFLLQMFFLFSLADLSVFNYFFVIVIRARKIQSSLLHILQDPRSSTAPWNSEPVSYICILDASVVILCNIDLKVGGK